MDVTPGTVSLARMLAQQHPLRAYDAVQLSTALQLNQDLIGRGHEPLTFICADVQLLNIARAEGLLAENPNDYP